MDLYEYHASDIKIVNKSRPLLGGGKFANVLEITVKRNGRKEKAALKKLKWERTLKDNSASRNKFENDLKHEAFKINQLSHPNIVKLYGVCYDDQYFGLILELCEGGSFSRMLGKLNREIPIYISTRWALQVAKGMKYLTEMNLMHRDLKGDNILIKDAVCFCENSETLTLAEKCPKCKHRPLDKIELKIADMGLTKSVKSVGRSIVGSGPWMAPEIHNMPQSELIGDVIWTEYADVWSFGVVLWEILAKELPHKDFIGIEALKVQDGQSLEHQEEWPEEWKILMERCGTVEPTDRPKFAEIVEQLENYQQILSEQERVLVKETRVEMEPPIRVVTGERCCSSPQSTSKTIYTLTIVIAILVATFLIILLFNLWGRSIDDSKYCAPEYAWFDKTERCYRAFVAPTTYSNATETCNLDGAKLASVHSIEENDFIAKLYDQQMEIYRKTVNVLKEKDPLLIGLEYNVTEKKWLWSDGTTQDYENWQDSAKDGDFAVMIINENSAKWIPMENSFKLFSFVCKKNRSL